MQTRKKTFKFACVGFILNIAPGSPCNAPISERDSLIAKTLLLFGLCLLFLLSTPEIINH